jgi:hypothetical protein
MPGLFAFAVGDEMVPVLDILRKLTRCIEKDAFFIPESQNALIVGLFLCSNKTGHVLSTKGAPTRRPYSDAGYDGFGQLAVRAIIDAPIKPRFIRLDPGQHQWPTTSGTGRPKSVDELKIKGVHGEADSICGLGWGT